MVDERGDLRNITTNRSLEASPIFNKQSIPNDLTAPISFISQQLEVNSKDIHDGDKLRYMIRFLLQIPFKIGRKRTKNIFIFISE